MYATEVNGQVLHLAVSGKLWRRSLVMIDEETKSFWSQLLGKAMDGKLKDTKLKLLPSVLTDWGSWKREHPGTTVLCISRTGTQFNQDFYKDPSRFLIGVSKLGKAKAWPFDQLIKKPLLNDEFDGTPVVVYFQPKSSAAYIYVRNSKGTSLSFLKRGDLIIDQETKSTWNLAIGKAIDGPRKGVSLKPVAGIPSFRKSWKTFYPDSEFWAAD